MKSSQRGFKYIKTDYLICPANMIYVSVIRTVLMYYSVPQLNYQEAL